MEQAILVSRGRTKTALAGDQTLSRAAKRLISRHVDSVGALDLLLLMHAGRDRDFSQAELCERLRCPESWAADQIARLQSGQMVAEVAEGLYRYRRGPEYGVAVDEIARACRRDRAAVTRLIFAHPPGTQFAH